MRRDHDDVLAGLHATPKHLPCRLLYDHRGSELFEQITTLPDYYLARNELALLMNHLPEIGRAIGRRARIVEPGSGAGTKTTILLEALDDPASYVPIEINAEQLEASARRLRERFPGLAIRPIHADYTAPLALPDGPGVRTLVFFPGATLGNFEPGSAVSFLEQLRALAGANGALLLGTDSNQHAASLLRAYDDALGVTAAFDLNVLAHVNHMYGATFERARFSHRATWCASRARVEMHLVSRCEQVVQVAGETFELAGGEPIVTEHCYKHRPEDLAAMLGSAGWRVGEVAVDPDDRMRLWLAFAA